MVHVLRERHGKYHDPNKYASERISGSIANNDGSDHRFTAAWQTLFASPDMVRLLSDNRRDSNRHTPEEIASLACNTDNIRAAAAYRAALAKNTVESYTKFIDTWPYDTLLVSYAKENIKKAKTPPYLRWLISHAFWIVWGAVVLLSIGIITVGQALHYHNY